MGNAPGILVAFEGIDGAGKTTQMGLLAELLRANGLTVQTTKEPTRGPHGQRIRESARSGRLPVEEELDLFIADRRQHAAELIRPALARGEVVLVDRYYFSSMAYQGVRGVDPEIIRARSEAVAPAPDLLIIIDVDPVVGLQRVHSRGDVPDEFEKLEDLRLSRGIFQHIDDPYTHCIDGSLTIQEVQRKVNRALYFGPLRDRLCEQDPACEGQCHAHGTRECRWAALSGMEPVPNFDVSAIIQDAASIDERLTRIAAVATRC